MPNHVRNHIKFTGVGAGEVMKSLANETDAAAQIFDFNRIVPEPENIGDGWYNWRCDNWGTKWNAYSIEPPQISSDGTEANVSFTTAWDPPEAVLAVLSKQHPNIEVFCQFFSEDTPYCGDFTLKNGKTIKSNIPEDCNAGIEYACYPKTPDQCGWKKDADGNWEWTEDVEF